MDDIATDTMFEHISKMSHFSNVTSEASNNYFCVNSKVAKM